MKPTTIVDLTIRYINGDEQHFAFTPEAGVAERANLASRLHRSFSADPIVIELADRVLFIPLQNVKNIELSPVPSKLPEGALLNVREVQRLG